MLGENLSVLTVPDLLLLEQQLDMGVSRVRARKASARSLLKQKWPDEVHMGKKSGSTVKKHKSSIFKFLLFGFVIPVHCLQPVAIQCVCVHGLSVKFLVKLILIPMPFICHYDSIYIHCGIWWSQTRVVAAWPCHTWHRWSLDTLQGSKSHNWPLCYCIQFRCFLDKCNSFLDTFYFSAAYKSMHMFQLIHLQCMF
jgi:hypothetical protein